MNLGIEYFVRSEFKNLTLFFPCSLFLTSKLGEKVVTTIDQENESYLVKYWHLSECQNSLALPPMKEIRVEDIFDKEVHLSNYSLLSFQEQPIPTSLNHWRRPMPKKDYDSYCNNILLPIKHESAKKFWLWKEFSKIYNPSCGSSKVEDSHNAYNWLGVKLRRSEIYESQINRLKRDCPNLWKYWNIWQKNLIKKSKFAGELIFHRIYN